jgi:hypothetical protein
MFLAPFIAAFVAGSVFGTMVMAVNSQLRSTCWAALQSFPDTPDIYIQRLNPYGSLERTRARAEKLALMGVILHMPPGSGRAGTGSGQSAPRPSEALDPAALQGAYRSVDALVNQGRVQDALALLRTLSAARPNDPLVDFKTACLYSRQGRTEDAAIFLDTALAKGFSDWKSIQTSSDLENVRHTVYYKRLTRFRDSANDKGLAFMVNESLYYADMLAERVTGYFRKAPR